MAELLDLEGVLAKLAEMTPLERMILSMAGTLQGALSAYFGEPVDVKVVSQRERKGGDIIERVAHLVTREGRVVVCRAQTRVEARNELVRKLVVERNLGLGQILTSLGLRSTFVLGAAGRTDEVLWRKYRLEGDGFTYRIREELPRALYETGVDDSRPPAWV